MSKGVELAPHKDHIISPRIIAKFVNGIHMMQKCKSVITGVTINNSKQRTNIIIVHLLPKGNLVIW